MIVIPENLQEGEMTASSENREDFFLKDVVFELFGEEMWNFALREQRKGKDAS